ncbi:MAG: T9SS type A sorting domain-containing protein [Paludibacteraceae bacterium]|nr:T9SS type A sorting domain-containing protein [Paludibacteraceae bacterium]
MKKLFLLLSFCTFLFSAMNAQTIVFTDDFSTNTSASWTTSGQIGSSAWYVSRSGDDWGARRNTSPEQLELTNDASGTANVIGWVFASVLTSGFSSPYNTTLNLNTGTVTWYFNMRQIRTDPAGFGSTSYGVAFILASSSSSPATNGSGYAVVLGQSGSTDYVRLAKYNNGLQGSLTDIITGSTDIGNEYLSICVTYNPTNDQWELFVRNDGASFADPTSGTLPSQGTATDNDYVGIELLYLGGYWQGSTGGNQTAFFDNVSVLIVPTGSTPTLAVLPSSLTGFSYVEGSGPSTSQSYTLSGTDLDGTDVTITAPTNYEVSLDDINWYDDRTLTSYDGSATTVYVRLKSGLAAGPYSGNVSNAGGGATTVNVAVSGDVYYVLPLSDEFDYTLGTNLTDNGWTAHSGAGSNPITVTSSLTYADYVSSGIGNAALLDNTGEDVSKIFESVSTGTVYYSFLVNVTTAVEGYFIHLANSPTIFAARVFVKNSSSPGKINFGISNTSTASYAATPTDFDPSTTYLIIVKYDLTTSDVSLWVFSSGVPATELDAGTPEHTNTGSGLTDISRICLRQYNSSQDYVIDGIRVATSWNDAPLPVELTTFAAEVQGQSVMLKWTTAQEINSYKYEIERMADGSEWSKIGEVMAQGNSSVPTNYSFADNNLVSGKYSYRLKMIDNDGTFEYSGVIEAEISVPEQYQLSQNYPNPFNPSTKISYSIPEDANVKLLVYSLTGELVMELVNENQSAGKYTVEFNANNLASGMYIYRLMTNKFVEIKKMIYLK